MATDMPSFTLYSCHHTSGKIPETYFEQRFASYPCPECEKKGIKGTNMVTAGPAIVNENNNTWEADNS